LTLSTSEGTPADCLLSPPPRASRGPAPVTDRSSWRPVLFSESSAPHGDGPPPSASIQPLLAAPPTSPSISSPMRLFLLLLASQHIARRRCDVCTHESPMLQPQLLNDRSYGDRRARDRLTCLKRLSASLTASHLPSAQHFAALL
jgi:hypothetical protein